MRRHPTGTTRAQKSFLSSPLASSLAGRTFHIPPTYAPVLDDEVPLSFGSSGTTPTNARRHVPPRARARRRRDEPRLRGRGAPPQAQSRDQGPVARAGAGTVGERFEREIQTAAALQQANIVPVLTAGDTDGLPFYTMPFVDGESLRARLGARAAGRDRSHRRAARRVEGARVRTSTGRRPSRHQAGQRAAVRRHGGRHRLRHRESHQRGAHVGAGRDAHADRHVDRHAGVHGAGAGRRRSRTSIIAPTSTRSARWRTNCSRGGRSSPTAPRSACSPRTWAKRRVRSPSFARTCRRRSPSW